MAENDFKYKVKHLAGAHAVIGKLLDKARKGGATEESDLDFDEADADKMDLVRRVTNGICDGKISKDTDPVLDPLESKLKRAPGERIPEVARGNDSRLRVERPIDSRYAGPTSVWSGCGDAYSRKPVALAKDGSVLRIDAIFGGAPTADADVSVDAVFPTLAKG